ncbi:MAG: hypothetical protein D6780_01560 [Candidatus Dadabacteria bacterium]|nr:MAG: hypothetical protein D6780_01560 [Candidatus Dadabacteria bacterium]
MRQVEKGYLISYGADKKVILWNLKDSTSFLLYQTPQEASLIAVNFRYPLLAVAKQETAEIVDLTSGKTLFKCLCFQSRISSMTFHPKKDILLVGAQNGNIYQWYYTKTMLREAKNKDSLRESQKIIERYVAHSVPVKSVVYHPSGEFFLSLDAEGNLLVWQPYSLDPFKGQWDKSVTEDYYFTDKPQFVGPTALLKDGEELVISKAGKFLGVGNTDGIVKIVLIRGLKSLLTFKAHKGLIYHLALLTNKEGKIAQVATVGRDGYVRVWGIKKEAFLYNNNESNKVLKLPLKESDPLSLVGEYLLPELPRQVLFINEKELAVGTKSGSIVILNLNSRGL